MSHGRRLRKEHHDISPMDWMGPHVGLFQDEVVEASTTLVAMLGSIAL